MHPMSKWGFIGVGIIVLFCWALWGVFFVKPMYELARTRAWVPSTCEILSSRVYTSTGGQQPSFRVDVKYRWSHGADTLTGTRYDLNGWTSSNAEEDCAEIVHSLPPGARVTCFVNPRDPREAVIDRDVDGLQVLAWIIAWAMLVLGGWIIRASVRVHRQSLAA
jgi:hypothetical protein